MCPLLLLTISYSRLQNSAYTNKLPNYQEQMKKDLYKDIRLFLLAIMAVSLFFSCSSVPSGIAEEINLSRRTTASLSDDYQRRDNESGEK